ncbi:MarR family winged helix-turn-helix transcriptional regulator [Acidocella sp.]|uniref:MarR family winged helix-turn-helix transcriptional regulator n=1 Tax=Acidocella sp. TaxID=50710 RepID=UPI003CFDC772
MKSGPDIPEAGEGKRGEEGYLGYLLRQAAHVHRQRQERALADLPMTLPQFAVLTMVHAYPGASGADLARLALLTPQTVGVIVKNLLRAGLLDRAADARHGRILHLCLTESGRTMLAEAKRRVLALEEELAAGLETAKKADLCRWLAKAARGRD